MDVLRPTTTTRPRAGAAAQPQQQQPQAQPQPPPGSDIAHLRLHLRESMQNVAIGFVFEATVGMCSYSGIVTSGYIRFLNSF